jgi:hypothetical protein
VQQKEAQAFLRLPSSSMKRVTLFSSEFDSDDFAYYCRGQGRFYCNPPEDVEMITKDYDHFNFTGLFSGLCCFCARMKGFFHASFDCVGCYHCKRRFMVLDEFSKLKQRKHIDGESPPSWAADGWAALPDSIINLILHRVLGEHALLSLQ